MTTKRKVVALTKAQIAKLTNEQKAVIIAKDALAQLKAERIIPKTGNYFVRTKADGTWLDSGPAEDASAKQVQNYVLRLKDCYACAKGTAALCYIRKFDGISGHGFSYAINGHLDELRVVLPRLDLMEACFEDWIHKGAYEFPASVQRMTPFKKLEWMWKNIIKNKGKLVLPGDTVPGVY